jgi:hypothetical protein
MLPILALSLNSFGMLTPIKARNSMHPFSSRDDNGILCVPGNFDE